ncbi:MAG: hypothetical protein Q9170_008030 [Blastenia crenularia]
MGGGKVPDAWDDDWAEKTDVGTSLRCPVRSRSQKPENSPRQSAEQNRPSLIANYGKMRMDESCQNPYGQILRLSHREAQNQNYFLTSRTEVPMKSEFKPAMKVLSRKPTTADAALAVGQLSLDNEEDDDEDGAKERTLTAEERQLKAQNERVEKQKKYEEARQRLFGAGSAPMEKSSGTVTPPRQRVNGESRGMNKNRGMRDGRQLASTGNGMGVARQLYDPKESAKPESSRTPTTSGYTTPIEQQPIRSPRGPDGSGRGGFGFAPRGGKVS